MTIKIQRGRQFMTGEANAELFARSGKSGGYLEKASAKLVEQQHTVQLRSPNGRTTTLKTEADWKAFLGKHAANEDMVKDFPKKFGITFADFVNVLDDVAAGDEKGLTLDLRPTSELAKSLSLDKVEGDYATRLAKDATVNLTGVGGAQVKATATGTPTIGKDILSGGVKNDWQRDRTEQEAWADFKVKDGSNGIFRRTNAASVFEKLHKPKWDDPEAMALVDRFTMPMHLEVSETKPDGTVVFQDRDEMFRETYFDDASGALSKAGASVRARVRFDDNEPFTVRRVLIQGKKGRDIDGDNSAVHKFEKRFEGTYSADEAKAQELLRSGKDTDGSNLKVAQLLYQTAQDSGTLPKDGNLRLEAKSLVLQKRRRSHMQFESVADVKAKRAELQKEMDTLKAGNQPIPPAMQKYADKLDAQAKFLEDASALLQKYGQYMPSNTDGFIISADRYSVYDPAARKTPPNDIDDEVGRVGRGLHLEAEWDTASSDPFEKAGEEIDKKLAANPANKAELEADKAKLEGMKKAILKDVEGAVLLMKEKMVAAGLEPDNRKLAKEERAAEFMADQNRAVNWL
ncbi:MAG: hypothetical protein AB1938_03060 [Myxococcota bacterium]